MDVVCFRRLNLFKAWELVLSSVHVYSPALLPVRELKRVGHQLKSIECLLDMGSRDLYSCRARVSAEKADRKLPPNRLSYFSVPSSSPSGVSWLGTEWRETLKIKPWRFGQHYIDYHRWELKLQGDRNAEKEPYAMGLPWVRSSLPKS